MKISFYKNLEFIPTQYIYDLSTAKLKGSFYLLVLNNAKEILEYLDYIINLISQNHEEISSVPLLKNNQSISKLIIEDLLKKDTILQKEYIDTLKNYEIIKQKNNDSNLLKLLKENVDRTKTRFKSKELILNIIKENIDFLKAHINTIDTYILKEKKKLKQAELFLTDTLEISSHKQEFYYQEKNNLRNIKSLSENLKRKYSNKVYLEKFSKIFENPSLEYVYTYDISSFREFFNVYFNEIEQDKIVIKKCKNCGKYFIPNNNQKYCDNPSPQNNNKTCKLLSNELKKKQDEMYSIYRSTYKTQHNKLNRYIKTGNVPENILKERFQKWNETAIHMKKICKNKNEYIKWYKTSLNWIKS